ncbi:uroporphyrinogen-III synthase [Mycobacterium shimoidei]|uniref:Putative transcriptional regulatory protein [Mycobacterium tuberculosis H37Rv] n=1 Tax=Mycobacterium shimoidei TaxID=29313 RepID=A0A1E3TCW6_MYCSH|nr:uroporphyrinogen-III synthase [Mycobacterium shimoidei]MCV7258505.1 uroporphyrinogen-III synthase [Mycobacterium shimoidei]ODR12273.1 uroporphyrinogen-III synthase [Mycobacterium shimoidei]ORW78385.1 bifunctional uroporphyrinogen-III synthetase/response regulator domain protein [Mycobacterium shimoidei]SRX92561.1 putative transcriptional regulatory protein [Mycobacterium tuberculosis H37Rv] [Mycobacterium shimoidei]
MGQPDSLPLAGYRVAVTSVHRADELCAMLCKQGATVCAAPAITKVALHDDDELHRHTEALVARPPNILIATTGIGFRGWIAAADGWGLTDLLLKALASARIVSRGPKATGALRAAGLHEEWSPQSESSREVLHYLLEAGVHGRRIALQLHGASADWDPFPEFVDELRTAGAEVVPVRVYRWQPAPPVDFNALVAQIAQRQVDAVSFTSAPAVAATLQRAREMGIYDQLLAALRTDVRAMCVGPVTAQPLVRLGIPTSSPQRMRLGALARHIADELPSLRSSTLHAAGHAIEIRGSCVLVDGAIKPLSPAGMATLRALAQRPGAVVARSELLRVLPGNGSDTHAVDTAVLRLRTALGDRNIVATVVKRGYRLAIDEQWDVA